MDRFETAIRTTVHGICYAMMWILLAAIGLLLFAALIDLFIEAGWYSAKFFGLEYSDGRWFTILYAVIFAGLAVNLIRLRRSSQPPFRL